MQPDSFDGYEICLFEESQRASVPLLPNELSILRLKFLQKSYPVMKKHNPHTPLLVREAYGVSPKIWARYEMGVESSIGVEGLSAAEVEKKLQELAQKQ